MRPQIIDQTFLTVHPVTAQWWKQREQCRQCKHHFEPPARGRDGSPMGEHCLAAPVVDRRRQIEECIDTRGTAQEREDKKAGACGPGAALFEPKEVAA